MVQYNELRTATLRSVFAGVYAVSFFYLRIMLAKLVELPSFVILFTYCNIDMSEVSIRQEIALINDMLYLHYDILYVHLISMRHT